MISRVTSGSNPFCQSMVFGGMYWVYCWQNHIMSVWNRHWRSNSFNNGLCYGEAWGSGFADTSSFDSEEPVT